MRAIHTFILVIALFIIVPVSALFAADNAQYTHPITVVNGIAMVDMGDHNATLDSVNENDQTIPAQRISGYNGNGNGNNGNDSTPITLPNTSAPHGTYTCTNVLRGVAFTVTNDTPCNER